MKREEVVVGGIYTNDGKVGMQVMRIQPSTARYHAGIVHWRYAFWDRAEPLPEIVYADGVTRFARLAKERVNEPVEGVVEVGEVPLS